MLLSHNFVELCYVCFKPNTLVGHKLISSVTTTMKHNTTRISQLALLCLVASTDAFVPQASRAATRVSSLYYANPADSSRKSENKRGGETKLSYIEAENFVSRTSIPALEEVIVTPAAAVASSKRAIDMFTEGDVCHFLNVAIGGVLLGLLVAFPGQKHEVAALSVLAIYAGQFGIMYDNMINGLGKYIGEGKLLRVLSKYKFLMHDAVTPMLAYPVTEIAARHGIINHSTESLIQFFLIVSSTIAAFYWHERDSSNLPVLDLRESKDNDSGYLAGTLLYRSGYLWKMLYKSILLVLYEIIVGFVILLQEANFDSTAALTSSLPMDGFFLAACGVLTLYGSSKRNEDPALQLYGEHQHNFLIWLAIMAAF